MSSSWEGACRSLLGAANSLRRYKFSGKASLQQLNPCLKVTSHIYSSTAQLKSFFFFGSPHVSCQDVGREQEEFE